MAPAPARAPAAAVTSRRRHFRAAQFPREIPGLRDAGLARGGCKVRRVRSAAPGHGPILGLQPARAVPQLTPLQHPGGFSKVRPLYPIPVSRVVGYS